MSNGVEGDAIPGQKLLDVRQAGEAIMDRRLNPYSPGPGRRPTALAGRDYLRAMAVDGDRPSQSGVVASRMGRAASSLGPARANLIAKGLVYAPEHGKIAFTVPKMADFVNRQPRN